MLGIPKPKEGLGTTIAGGTSVVKTRHGRMHCKVGVPISARARAEGKVQRELGTLTPGEGKPYDAAGKKFILDLGYEVRTDFAANPISVHARACSLSLFLSSWQP